MEMTRDNLLALVNRSPEAVKVHDKSAWMDIFSRFSVVEDPVGCVPHVNGLYDMKGGSRGKEPLSRFYDTFIAPNDISFQVERDIVCGHHVLRDLSLVISMSEAVTAEVPMHLLYEVIEEEGELKIQRLAAHWEMMAMNKQLFAKGSVAWPVLMSSFWRLLRYQGLKGTVGFSRGLSMLGESAKQQVQTLFAALNNHALVSVQDAFYGDACFYLAREDLKQPLSLYDLRERMPGRVELGKTLVAGYMVSCSYTYTPDGEEAGSSVPAHNGVLLCEFNHKAKKLNHVTFYYES